MAVSSSLFDKPADPVMDAASEWVTGTLLGSVAIGLCVIAVAVIGLMLMTGRFAIRDAARVVIGCFVLLGAPLLALGLREAASGTYSVTTAPSPAVEIAPKPTERPPANYDPYAGASLRRD